MGLSVQNHCNQEELIPHFDVVLLKTFTCCTVCTSSHDMRTAVCWVYSLHGCVPSLQSVWMCAKFTVRTNMFESRIRTNVWWVWVNVWMNVCQVKIWTKLWAVFLFKFTFELMLIKSLCYIQELLGWVDNMNRLCKTLPQDYNTLQIPWTSVTVITTFYQRFIANHI